MTTTVTTEQRPLRERAADIAQALGQGWSVARIDPDRHHEDRVTLDGPDGQGLFLEVSRYRSPGRIFISGVYPHDERNVSYAPREPLSISVAEGRPVGEIAREIVRRFLPGYQTAYREARERLRRDEEIRAAERGLIARLAPLVGATAPAHAPNRATHYHQGGTYIVIETHGSSADLKLDRLPGDVAARVLAIVAEHLS